MVITTVWMGAKTDAGSTDSNCYLALLNLLHVVYKDS